MRLHITYWQAAQYVMDTEISAVLPALRVYLDRVPSANIADTIGKAEAASRGEPVTLSWMDIENIQTALKEDGQMAASSSPARFAPPEDFAVEVQEEQPCVT